MKELVINLHNHSRYSDGSGTFLQIANAGLRAGVDVLIVTDHNVFIQAEDKYFKKGAQRLLFLTGEEIHDRNRQPQKNHLLVFGHTAELSVYAGDPQLLINKVQEQGGLSFLAHPFEDALNMIGEPDISWVDWQVHGFSGIEIWNHLSELKSRSPNWLKLLWNVFFPATYSVQPNPKTLQKWDSLTRPTRKLVAIGGSDAHALHVRKAFIQKVVFPYQFHFQCVNNHVLVPEELSGNILSDKQMILDGLRNGHTYVGYDLPASTRGFRFSAQGTASDAIMGDDLPLESSVTLQIRLPLPVECVLLRNGKKIAEWQGQDICTKVVNEPGVYRVECFISYLGRKRGWIYSNPIYIQPFRNSI